MSFIENESDWLCTEILPELLTKGLLVDNYDDANLGTFQVSDIDIKMIGAEEAFMLTQCYRATISFDYAGLRQQRKLVIKKTPPIPPETYDSISFDALFNNEIQFYTNILHEIQKISDGKFAAPKYYHSEIKPGFALLILGDFAEEGWSITKDRVGLSLEHVRIAVKYLGSFHGFGYALKHCDSDKFFQLSAKLTEPRYADDNIHPEWGLTIRTSSERVAKAVKKYQPEVDEEFVKKWEQLTGDYIDYGRKRVAPREPLATLCHGDFLRNNIAYKYITTGGEAVPVDVMMFDYQTLRVSSPMIDLSVFLANSVYANVRQKYFDSIFNDYCQALAKSFTEYSKKDIPEFLSRDNLIKEYIRFLPYSLGISASFLMTLVDPPNVTSEEMFNNQRTDEQVINDTMTRGGEVVDKELAHQIKEMQDLSRLYQVEIDENIL
ncbi:uncharacterized protein LOC115633662 [Scaptodrosophila lebanonensis]|uniref:Uncharacterized protein LOC115633662 n=1 Tax=Drosophila lebanonensis TaxID=7225 RepID=A0A6J2UID2_DROLE|nr:uncharacterized protein LOC115633662 [Scaptodrosophila lebanonensis]